MFVPCTTTDLIRKKINAFKNEDGNLVIERNFPLPKEIHIVHPKDVAGYWIISNPEKSHVEIPYGPQGLVYTPIFTINKNL